VEWPPPIVLTLGVLGVLVGAYRVHKNELMKMNLKQLHKDLGTQEKCDAYLEIIRWGQEPRLC
jgi:hypothetical protein